MIFDRAAWWSVGALVVIGYVYVLYPLAIAVIAACRHRSSCRADPGSVSVVMVLRNEEDSITRRLGESCAALNFCGIQGEVVVVSDGSTDKTVELVNAFPDSRVRLLALPSSLGKAAALTKGVREARYELVVLGDARQSWTAETIHHLIAPLADPEVGAVGGTLRLTSDSGELTGVGLYWRYETWIRSNESRVHSTVGVSGAIAAVRRELFADIPAGTILDDVYWPLRVAMSGRRVVHAEAAIARDRLPRRHRDEFRRKVRTLAGNFQLLNIIPQALIPWRNPIWIQYISHKILRLVVPWALILLFVASAMSALTWLHVLLFLQLGFYSIGAMGLMLRTQTIGALPSAISAFILLNAAAWVAFWVWISGRSTRSWVKVAYGASPPQD